MSARIVHVPGSISYAELKRRTMGGRVVRIGYPAGPTEQDGTPLALIAAVHEFGSTVRNIPERSFLRSTMNENMAKYIRMNRGNLQRVVNGHQSMHTALSLLGQVAVGDVKRKIRNGPFAELQPSTIRRKGSSKPLIDSGMLMQSVTYEVDQ